jgi:hypothetical protein
MKKVSLGSGDLVYEVANTLYEFKVKDDTSTGYGGSSLDTTAITSNLLSTAYPVPTYTGGYKVIPEGVNNNIPQYLRDTLDTNHLGGSVLDKMCGLILVQGIGQYTESITKDNKIARTWVQDNEISAWLKSWDYKEYIINSMEDYVKGGSIFSKLLRNVGGRISGGGMSRINELQHVCAPDCRREWPNNKNNINHVLVGDWINTGLAVEIYTVWNRNITTLKPAMMAFRTLYRFGRGILQPILPNYWGILSWMGLSTDIPAVLNNLSENTLGIKWHIISPQSYWDQVEAKLKVRTEQEGKTWKDEILEDYKETFLTSLASVLAGKKNVGKFIHTQAARVDIDLGKTDLDKWEFLPLDMQIDKFVTSQIAISSRADVAIASGMGLAPSLSNIIADGRQASGSESLYAYKLFQTSAVYKVEYMVFGIINDVIAFNWPNKDIRLGFYSEPVMQEQNVTPSNRVANTVN